MAENIAIFYSTFFQWAPPSLVAFLHGFLIFLFIILLCKLVAFVLDVLPIV